MDALPLRDCDCLNAAPVAGIFWHSASAAFLIPNPGNSACLESSQEMVHGFAVVRPACEEQAVRAPLLPFHLCSCVRWQHLCVHFWPYMRVDSKHVRTCALYSLSVSFRKS